MICEVTENVSERRPSGVAAINWVQPSVLPVCPRTTPQRVSYRKIARPAEFRPRPADSDAPSIHCRCSAGVETMPPEAQTPDVSMTSLTSS